MIDEEFLAQAVEVAVARGWEIWSHRPGKEVLDLHRTEIGVLAWESIVFNWGFATALWGGKEVHYYDLVDLDNGGKTETVTMPIWKYHLKQMVTTNDPIAYLAGHMPDAS